MLARLFSGKTRNYTKMASADDTSLTDSSFLNTTYPTMNDSVATDGNVSSAPTEDELREQVSPERFYGIVVSFAFHFHILPQIEKH